MDHKCRAGGKPVGPLNWPPFADPGEIVKVAGAERWGRVDILWRCCGVIDVAFSRESGEDPEVLTLTRDDVAPVYGSDYPASQPPNGYRIPVRWPREVTAS